MILYILKSVLCSATFISTYYLFLEKEKIHRFKRGYLLGTITLSLLIPLLTIELVQPETTIPQYFSGLIPVSETASYPSTQLTAIIETESADFSWTLLYIILYASVTSVLLLRFFNSFLTVLSSVNRKNITLCQNAVIVADDSVIIPFTFLKYIFVNNRDVKNQQILMHELTHARQKHTLDILFIEFIHCILWFNPVLVLYKKAIRLNHEFLADEKVVKNHSVHEYQNLLLQKCKPQSLSALTSSLNYSITKKRIIMMSKTDNQTRSMIRMIFSSILACSSIILFSEKVYAQNDQIPPVVITQDTTRATPEMVSEFDALIGKYTYRKEKTPGQIVTWFNTTGITNAEKTRMQEIYKAMSAEQRSKYPAHSTIIFTPFPLPKKNTPTAQEFAAYADAAVYGIWLDGKRVANTELAKYQPHDFSHVFKSRLLKNAANYGQYKFHVDLMTQDYFEKTYPPKFK